MHKAKELPLEERRKLGGAFYCLAHNDFAAFEALEERLKDTDVGRLCQQYIDTGDSALIDRAGNLMAGPQWYTALGR